MIGLLSLPLEIIEEILVLCSVKDIHKVSESCKRLHALIHERTDSHIWRSLFLSTFDDPRVELLPPASSELTTVPGTEGSGSSDVVHFDWYNELMARLNAAEYIRAAKANILSAAPSDTNSDAPVLSKMSDYTRLNESYQRVAVVLASAHRPMPAGRMEMDVEVEADEQAGNALMGRDDDGTDNVEEGQSKNIEWVRNVVGEFAVQLWPWLLTGEDLTKKVVVEGDDKTKRVSPASEKGKGKSKALPDTTEIAHAGPRDGTPDEVDVEVPVNPSAAAILEAMLNNHFHNHSNVEDEDEDGDYEPPSANDNSEGEDDSSSESSNDPFSVAPFETTEEASTLYGKDLVEYVRRCRERWSLMELAGHSPPPNPTPAEQAILKKPFYSSRNTIGKNAQDGGSSSSSPANPFSPWRTRLAARKYVYDMRNYSPDTQWGPWKKVTKEDGTEDYHVNWKHAHSILNVIVFNLYQYQAQFSRLTPPIDLRATAPGTVIGWNNRDPRDWAGVEGLWKRVICFMDYRDLVIYNLRRREIASEKGLDDTIFYVQDFGEAVRLLMVELHISSIDRPEESLDPLRPTLRFKGHSRGGTPNASTVHGHVRVTANGDIEWHMVANFGGEDRWESSGVQVGGQGSAFGILGCWSPWEHDSERDPAGPYWMFKTAQL